MKTTKSSKRRSQISRFIQPCYTYIFMMAHISPQMKNSFRKGLFHPNDIKTVGLGSPSPGPMTAPLPELSHRRSRPSLSPIVSPGPASSGPASARAHSRSSSFVGANSDSFGREQAKRLQSDFGKYAEDDDEDYEDVFGKANGTSAQPMQTLQLNTRLSNKSWVGGSVACALKVDNVTN